MKSLGQATSYLQVILKNEDAKLYLRPTTRLVSKKLNTAIFFYTGSGIWVLVLGPVLFGYLYLAASKQSDFRFQYIARVENF